MKNNMFIFIFFITINVFAQLIEPQPVKITDEIQIEQQILKLQKELNNIFNEEVRQDQSSYYVKINIIKMQLNKNKATVDCEINYADNKESQKVKGQKLKFFKNKTWSLEEYPKLLDEKIKKINENNKAKGSVENISLGKRATEQEIQIELSEDVFLPYPILEHPNDGDVYEINHHLTEEELGIQMFAASSKVDGCVYYRNYVSETDYDRVVFYVDPKWRRIIFSREIDDEYQEIVGYYGDDNVRFNKPLAIDINENGEIFVLDAGERAVYKLYYDAANHKIISTSSSKIINSQNLENPSDLGYSNRDTYHNTTDDYIVISDLGKQSVMLFNYSGTLLNEYTQYAGINISEPNSVEIVNKFDYPSIYFIDGQRLVKSIIYNDYSISSSYSSPFPGNSDLQGVGLFSVMGEIDGIIVADRSMNLLHLFDPISVKYYCSYEGEGNNFFIAPQSIFSTAYAHYEHSNEVRLDFFTMDMWSRSRGIKRFVPGSDILNIEVNRGYFNYILTFDEVFIQDTEIDLYRSLGGGDWFQIVDDGSPFAYDWVMADDHLYKWVIRYKPKFDNDYGYYGIGWKTKEIEFTTNFVMPSVIDEDKMIQGDYEVNSNVTINQGATLTVFGEGGTITFNNNSRLNVYGGLTVNGYPSSTYPSNPTFDFLNKIGGIYAYQGSTIDLDGAIIKNSYYGVNADHCNPIIKHTNITNTSMAIRAYYSSPLIENCNISSSYYGIYAYYSNNPTVIGDLVLKNNTIDDIDAHGIYLYNSSAHIRGNEISNCNRAIYANNQSNAWLGELAYLGNNEIYDNSYGVYAYNDSYMLLGKTSCETDAGNNSVFDNTTENAKVLSNASEIQASYTWWGSSPPNTSLFYIGSGCTLVYSLYLPTNPLQKIASNNVSPEEVLYNENIGELSSNNTADKKYHYDKKWPLDWKILYIRNLVMVKDYEFAQKICEEIIDNYPDSSQSLKALSLYKQSSKIDDFSSFIKYLNKKVDSKKTSTLNGMIELCLLDLENVEVKNSNKYKNLVSKYEKRGMEEIILFHDFTYNLVDLEDYDNARKIYNKLAQKFENSELTLEAQRSLGDKMDEPNDNSKALENERKEKLVDQYELLGNYPNPFNPSTRIKYATPFISNINLEIYDISGSLVKSFEINSQSPGHHEILWDGRNISGNKVASGIYFYKLKALSIEGNAKSFEKTAKFILMK